MRLFLFPILIILCSAGSFQLMKKDVRRATDMMLKLHVEQKEFSPLLAKRSVKLYLEYFDPDKIYFTAKEVQPFIDLKEERLRNLTINYLKDDLTEYAALNQVIQGAIIRARQLRAIVANELVESEEGFRYKLEIHTDFAKSETELKERIKHHLAYLEMRERQQSGAHSWDKEQKRGALELWERRYHRLEDPYLSVDKNGKALPREITEHFLALHTLKAIAKSLDAHTSYYSPEEAHDMRTSLEKQFEGIGILLRESVQGIAIVGLVRGGPAERSGRIRIGDVITGIDGKSVIGLSYEEILRKLQEANRGQVQLELKRVKDHTEERVKVSVAKEKIVMEDDRLTYRAEPFADGIIGKLALSSFYESGDGSSCEKDIREALRQLKKQGNLLGIVLDLRENSGGFLSQAVKVASLFLSSGVVVISKYAQGETHYLRNLDIHSYYNGPLVVLTSKASASAAEIVAQALQDYGTALVIGDERTYGKGTIQYQTVTDPSASCFFKVTVGRYYTVSGRTTQIDGVLADIVVPSHYYNLNIGERFLTYPLKSDRVLSAYADPLSDIEQKNRVWFQQNYIPHLQKKISIWTRMIPALKANTEACLSKSKDFSLFLKVQDGHKQQDTHFQPTPGENWGVEDLQMHQAVRILKDMIYLKSCR